MKTVLRAMSVAAALALLGGCADYYGAGYSTAYPSAASYDYAGYPYSYSFVGVGWWGHHWDHDWHGDHWRSVGNWDGGGWSEHGGGGRGHGGGVGGGHSGGGHGGGGGGHG